jgi:hypothetical protein
MTLYYADPEAGANIPVKTRTVSGEQVPSHDVAALPGTVEADVTASKGFLETLANAVASAAMKVVLQTGANAIGKLAANAGVNIGTVDIATSALPAGAAQDRTTAASPHAARLSTGSAFYDAAKTGQLPTALGAGASSASLSITHASNDPAIYDAPTSGTLGALNASVQTLTGNRSAAGFCFLGGGNLVGTLVAECLIGNWQTATIYDPATGTSVSSIAVSSPVSDILRTVILPPGANNVRLRVSAWTSGSGSAFIGMNNANLAVSKLDSIIAAQAVPSAGPKFGQNTSIGSGSDAQFTSQTLSRGMVITNLDTAINLLISHQTGPSAAGSTTRTIKPGMSSSFIACTNVTAVYMRSASGTIAACYEGV